jgi:hypothetical protein
LKTTIRAHLPILQEVTVSCNYEQEWGTYLFNIYAEESYPKDRDRKKIAEEVTLSFNSQADVEKLIDLIRRATKKIPKLPKLPKTLA